MPTNCVAKSTTEDPAPEPDDESEADDGVEYDENGDPVDNAGASDDVEYDEYGNVIDSDNTVSPDDYESEQSSDSEDRKSTRLNSSHVNRSRMPSSA